MLSPTEVSICDQSIMKIGFRLQNNQTKKVTYSASTTAVLVAAVTVTVTVTAATTWNLGLVPLI